MRAASNCVHIVRVCGLFYIGGNEMRGFGGIFPLVPEGDVEGIKRSSELFEDRLELAQGDCAGGC